MQDKIAEKVKFYKSVNDLAVRGEIAVFGSTYAANFPFYELMQGKADYAVYNRSIEGLSIKNAAKVAQDCLKKLNPSKLFLCFGEEELATDGKCEKFAENYLALIRQCKTINKNMKIFLLPVMCENAEKINETVSEVAKIAGAYFVTVPVQKAYRSIFNRLNFFFRSEAPSFCDAFGM